MCNIANYPLRIQSAHCDELPLSPLPSNCLFLFDASPRGPPAQNNARLGGGHDGVVTVMPRLASPCLALCPDSASDLSRAFVSPGSRPRLLGGRSPGDTCSCQICKIQSKFIPITNSCKIIFWVFGKCVAYMYLLYKKKKEILKALGFWS